MGARSYRYRLVDLRETSSEDVEFTVKIETGDTVRGGDGRLMVVVSVVEIEDEPPYAGVLLVEPLQQ
jgi:hypothetical protein